MTLVDQLRRLAQADTVVPDHPPIIECGTCNGTGIGDDGVPCDECSSIGFVIDPLA